MTPKEQTELNPRLHRAAAKGTGEEVHSLITEGADKNANIDGWTPLHRAVIFGNADSRRALLDEGVNIAAQDSEKNWTAIDIAANKNIHGDPTALKDRDALKEMLASVTDKAAKDILLNAQDRIFKRTPLHLAAAQGNEDDAFILIREGARHLEDINGQKPSQLAQEAGHAELSEKLRADEQKQASWAGRTAKGKDDAQERTP